jgi:hypothetical protein
LKQPLTYKNVKNRKLLRKVEKTVKLVELKKEWSLSRMYAQNLSNKQNEEKK